MAQLGARFHGMEEVVSSNLTRSTNTFPFYNFCCRYKRVQLSCGRGRYCLHFDMQVPELCRDFFIFAAEFYEFGGQFTGSGAFEVAAEGDYGDVRVVFPERSQFFPSRVLCCKYDWSCGRGFADFG